MKIELLREQNKGSYDDDDVYSLVRDEDGSYYVEHWWHHWRPSGVDQGEIRTPLEDLKHSSPRMYERAMEAIRDSSEE